MTPSALMVKTKVRFMSDRDRWIRLRAAEWAEERGLKCSGSRWRCAHGLSALRPPEGACGCLQHSAHLLDNATLWNRDGKPAVLLAHSWDDAGFIAVEADLYAAEFALDVTIGDPDDAWFRPGTTPIRWELIG